MGPPRGFSEEAWTLDFPSAAGTELTLWRPGALGRWADRMVEDDIELIAPPLGDDPVALAAEFARTPWRAQPALAAGRAEFLLRSTGRSWEFHARHTECLVAVRNNIVRRAGIRCEPAAKVP
jgi:hypothetical protein